MAILIIWYWSMVSWLGLGVRRLQAACWLHESLGPRPDIKINESTVDFANCFCDAAQHRSSSGPCFCYVLGCVHYFIWGFWFSWTRLYRSALQQVDGRFGYVLFYPCVALKNTQRIHDFTVFDAYGCVPFIFILLSGISFPRQTLSLVIASATVWSV